jgi:putative flippase GtrA
MNRSSTTTQPANGGNASARLTNRQQFIQFAKFTLFSISAGAIQFASFTLLNETTGLPYWPSYLIALVLSVLWNFTLNRRFTFKSACNVPLAMLLVAGYYAVFTPLSTWWGAALTDANWNEYIVLAGTMVINFVTEFLFQRFVVFNKTINTNNIARKSKKA